jgi:myo-inositol 2-dehydrogenase/D-chiro-inositol 1-dehydrogenase/scyllo-inositol 2-dehydrogenase (NAD+)
MSMPAHAGEIVGVAVIGGGRAGLIHAHNLGSGRVKGARLVAVVEPVEAVRAQVREVCPRVEVLDDYRLALAHPAVQAVVVTAPTVFHREIVVATAGAGRHVLCEKPMAMTVAECDAMIEATTAARVNLQIGFMRRFDPEFVHAWDQVRTGAIGDVVLVKSLTHGPSVPRPWMYDLAKSNGPLAEVNSHDIDTLRWFTGSEFAEVHAIGGNYRCPEARAAHPDFYDNVVLIARFRNGMQGFIGGAQGVGYAYDARCEILGTRGLVQAGRLAADTVTVCTAEGVARQPVRSWQDLFAAAYQAEDQEFVDSIREGRPPRVTGWDGRMAVAVVTAGNQSIRERRPVEVVC